MSSSPKKTTNAVRELVLWQQEHHRLVLENWKKEHDKNYNITHGPDWESLVSK